VALRRLALLFDALGDSDMRAAAVGISQFVYRDGMWKNAAPGASADVPVAAIPAPALD
jgi:hypothetical protein